MQNEAKAGFRTVMYKKESSSERAAFAISRGGLLWISER
jgi:hypothetical protein